MRKLLTITVIMIMVSSMTFYGLTSDTLETSDLTAEELAELTSGRQLTEAGCTDWAITTIDSFGNVGYMPSADLDSNDKVHVSYSDITNKHLKYSEISNSGAQFSSVVVDSTSGYDTGYVNDLIVDMDDNIHIIYQSTNMSDANDSLLKHAFKPATSNSWTISIVDTGKFFPYLAVDVDDLGGSGNLHIAYNKDGTLWYGLLPSATSLVPSWTLEAIPAGSNIHGIDIAINSDNDEPSITFGDSSHSLVIAKGQGQGNQFIIETIDSPTTGYIGIDTDIEYTSIGAEITYTNYHNNEIKHVEETSNGWSISSLFTGTLGLSMAMDSSENPHIVWHIDNVNDIMYAQFDSSMSFMDVALDNEGVGQLDNELDSNDIPHVVYLGGNSDLMYTTCDDTTVVTPPTTGGPCDIDVSPGLVWDANTEVSTGDVYEYPAGSGDYHVVVILGYVDQIVGAPGVDLDVWSKNPCSCEDIWIDSGMPTYDASVQYLPGNVVEYPVGTGTVWMAIIPAAVAGVAPDEPWADGNDWEKCVEGVPAGGPCASFNGQSGPAWDYGVPVSTDAVYEYPADSGIFYQMWQPNHVDLTIPVTPEDPNSEKYWLGPCTCEEIWWAGPGTVWSANDLYSGNPMVEWPAGSQFFWYNNEIGGFGTTPVTTDEPGIDPHWKECKIGGSQTGPCSEFEGSIGDEVWSPNSVVVVGNVYEYPTNSGLYYLAHNTDPNGVVTVAPDQAQAYEFWTRDCTCDEIWMDAGMPIWDSTIDYESGMVVEHPANSGDIWISTDSSVIGDHPGGSNPTVWNKCITEVGGSPCAGFDALDIQFMGTWEPSVLVSLGEVYEYPPASGIYYQIVIPFDQPTMVGSPGVDLDAWAPIACPCKDTWMANGQPIWDDTMLTYPGNYVVEWPAGSMNLWITEGGGLAFNVEPGTDPHWMPCQEMPSEGGPCAGLDVIGVWEPGTLVEFGQVYEYPAGYGMFYEIVIPFNTPTIVGAPGHDLDAWAPIACPCKETWHANGQPIWDSNNNGYPGNFVVEWPAGSQILYISEGGGLTSQAGEPGIDSHWMPCEMDQSVQQSTDCAGLEVVGVWEPGMNVSFGDIYEYPANSGMHYSVVIPFMSPTNVGAPGLDLDAWEPIACPCKETWYANSQPVWDASQFYYPGNYVVEWPAGSQVLYISESGGLTGAGEPGVDNHWISCDQTPAVNDGPCNGFDGNFAGTWSPSVEVSSGEVYEYPASSGVFYEVVIQGYSNQLTNSPLIDMDVWASKVCPCKETWNDNGMPVWDATQMNYPGNYVVEWPASSGVLYISEGGGLTGSIEPGTDGHWLPCTELDPDSNSDGMQKSDDDDKESDDSVPSIGVFGTIVAVSLGFFIATRREQ
jgi:hypothetical protein